MRRLSPQDRRRRDHADRDLCRDAGRLRRPDARAARRCPGDHRGTGRLGHARRPRLDGPRFFGWVIGNSHPTGVAADWLVAAWGQNVGNLLAPRRLGDRGGGGRLAARSAGPAARGLGRLRHRRDRRQFRLPGRRARRSAAPVGWDVEADGLFGAPPVRVLIGADAHATVFSGLKYLGLGAKRVTTVETDDLGRMRPPPSNARWPAPRRPGHRHRPGRPDQHRRQRPVRRDRAAGQGGRRLAARRRRLWPVGAGRPAAPRSSRRRPGRQLGHRRPQVAADAL
jgi:hypothetical protein